MGNKKTEFISFSWRVTSMHMIAYIVAGMIAFTFLNYDALFTSGAYKGLMKPTNAPIVAFGPSLQIIVGFVLSIILFPFRSVFLSSRKGWLYLFLLITGFCIFTPEVAGPGNFEGLIYTNISIQEHLLGLPETILYAILLSVFLPLWCKHPKKIWTILSIIAVVIIFLIGLLGYFDAVGII